MEKRIASATTCLLLLLSLFLTSPRAVNADGLSPVSPPPPEIYVRVTNRLSNNETLTVDCVEHASTKGDDYEYSTGDIYQHSVEFYFGKGNLTQNETWIGKPWIGDGLKNESVACLLTWSAYDRYPCTVYPAPVENKEDPYHYDCERCGWIIVDDGACFFNKTSSQYDICKQFSK